MPRTVALYPFRFFDLRTRRWHRARYVATIDQMTVSHEAVQVLGAPEIRDVPDDWRELTAGNLAAHRR